MRKPIRFNKPNGRLLEDATNTCFLSLIYVRPLRSLLLVFNNHLTPEVMFGTLIHLGIDALIVSAFLAGVKRNTGLTYVHLTSTVSHSWALTCANPGILDLL